MKRQYFPCTEENRGQTSLDGTTRSESPGLGCFKHMAIPVCRGRRFGPSIFSRHRALGFGARRYTRELSALAELVPADGNIILLQADPIKLPRGIIAAKTAFGVQMVLDHLVASNSEIHSRIEPLGDKDVTEMVALAKLTKPGPFETGTPRLSQFWDIKEKGRPAAMAGERMKHIGHSEISGVCSHPDFRGRGFARALSAAVANKIIARGEVPYLHSYSEISSAIRLYESLGFQIRCEMYAAVLARS
jgi:ribosomal protein S18 acetylase RimI-like enzyme